jgi:molecular chaperone GrpE
MHIFMNEKKQTIEDVKEVILEEVKKEDETLQDVADEFEFDDEIVEEGGSLKKIKKLRAQLKESDEKKKEYLDGWQRARADFANKQKDTTQSLVNAKVRGVQSLASSLFAPMDAFDMAMKNKEAWEAVDMNWRVGIEYIYKQIATAFEEQGITQIDPAVGSEFDAAVHEPGEMRFEAGKEGEILDIIRKGYKHKETVLRPAQVVVGSQEAPKTEE